MASAAVRRIAFAGGDGSALVQVAPAADAPVVLLIHPANLQASCWAEVMEKLPDFTCVAIDLLGHGDSRRLESYSVDRWVDECIDLLSELDLSDVHVVGASVGAAVAVGLASARPHIVRTLITVGGATHPASTEIDQEFRAAVETLGPAGVLAEAVAIEPGMTRARIAHAMETLSRNDAKDVLGIWGAAAVADARPLFGEVSCPTLAVVGELDSSCPPTESAEFARATLGRLVVLPGYGHLPMLTAASAVADAIAAHIRTHDFRRLPS